MGDTDMRRKASRIWFHECVPTIMHIVAWFVWTGAAIAVGWHVVCRLVPAIGTTLLSLAAIPEEAMLVTWVYGYIMPYLVACALMVGAYFLGMRATWRWLDGHVSKIAERVRVWYDGRQ